MASYEDTVMALSPVGYWRLDELSGTVITALAGPDGVYNAGAGFGAPSPIETDAGSHAIYGKVGHASSPSGSPTDVKAGLTWMGWGFHDHLVAARTIMSRAGQWGLNGGNMMGFNEGDVSAQISFTGFPNATYVLSIPLLVGYNYFVVATRNGPVFSLYVNGELVSRRVDLPVTDVLYANNPSYGGNWIFGTSGSENVWDGYITDEIAIFDYPLSDAEILTVYEAAINQILLHGYANVVPTAVLYSDIPATPVSFPFRHNWDSRLIERITFKTNVTRARTGIEEGWIVRPKPRRELELVQVLKNNDERKRLRAQLWAHQNATWFVPVRQDVALLDSPLTNGDTVVPVTTAYMDYEVGGYIGLRQLADDGSITHWEYQQITAVNTLSVECAPLTYDYEANKSHVYPARRALLDKSISVKGHAAEVEELTIIARLLAEDEATVPNRITVWHPTIKYRDYEIFDPSVWQSNDWDELRDYSIDRELDDIDFNDGVFGVDADTPGAAEAFSYRMKLEGRDEIAKLLGWFYERAGSGRYLWVPSMQRDYDILGVSDLLFSPRLLTVAGTNYTDNFAGAEARRDIAFVFNDLSMVCRRVIDFTDDPETLTLDADIPSLTNLKFVSILKFCRLDADSLEIAWETNTKATFSWRFRELAHSPEGTGASSLSASHSASFSRSASASLSPSVSVSPSHSASPSVSESPSPSPSVSPSASGSPSVSPSVSGSPSHSESPSVSPSGSGSASTSPSASPSHSTSPSVSPSASASPSPSPSISPSASASPSSSVSPSTSPSSSVSPSVSPSASTSPSSSASPSGAFSPSDLADIWDWWEPSRESLSNTDPIATLNGQANNRDFTNGTAGQQILYDTDNALNGLAVGNFASGTKQLFGPDMSALTTAAHVFYVLRVVAQAGSNGVWLMGSNSPGPPLVAHSDNHIYESAFRSNNRPDMGATVIGLQCWNIYEVESASNSWKVRINGVQQGSTQNPNTVAGLAAPRIGHNGSQQGKGYFAGLYVCSAVISGTDRSNLITYLVDRFGLDGTFAFVVTPTLGSLRSNYTGQVGFKITMIETVDVTHLGRWRVSGNSQTHTLRIVRASDNSVLGSVSYDASAGTVGAFNYVALGSPVTLSSGQAYYITSEESNGGDQWYDTLPIAYQNVGTVNNSTNSSDGTTWAGGVANQTYVPVDFKFNNRVFT